MDTDGNMLGSEEVKRLWKRVQSLPKGQDLIWWLIEKQRAVWKQIIAFILFVVLFRVTTFTFLQAIIMVISMYLHELGHASIFYLTKIKFVLLYIFPLGAVAAPSTREENEKSDKLPWWQLGVLLLAGPLVNLILMFVGRLLTWTDTELLKQLGSDLVFINSLLLFMNIIPIWHLDAGQFFKLIYSSMIEKHDRLLSSVFTFFILGVTVFTLFKIGSFDMTYTVGQLIHNFNWIVFGLVFVICSWYTQGKDDPSHSQSDQRMTFQQSIPLLAGYFFIVVSALMVL